MSALNREQAWTELRQFFGSEPYQKMIQYLEAEEMSSIENLIRSEDAASSDHCRGEVRILRKILNGLRKPGT